MAPWVVLVAGVLVLAGCSQLLNTWAFAKPSAQESACGEPPCGLFIFDVDADVPYQAMESPLPQDSSPPEGSTPPEESSPSEDDYEPEFPPEAGCSPPDRAPAVRPVKPKVQAAVDRQWKRIETWLRANAPKTHAQLGPPAESRDIAAVEARIGLRFPDSLRASLLRHNGNRAGGWGSGFGFLGHWNMSIKDIGDTWTMMCEIDPGEEGDPRSEWWSSRMIPFGDFGDGGNLVIDSVVGDIGWYFNKTGTSFAPDQPWRGSYYALLKASADVLEQGGDLDGWKPVVDEGELGWDPS